MWRVIFTPLRNARSLFYCSFSPLSSLFSCTFLPPFSNHFRLQCSEGRTAAEAHAQKPAPLIPPLLPLVVGVSPWCTSRQRQNHKVCYSEKFTGSSAWEQWWQQTSAGKTMPSPFSLLFFKTKFKIKSKSSQNVSIHLAIYSFLQCPSHHNNPPCLFPKAAYNPLHLQKLRTLLTAKSGACDLASATTASARKTERLREEEEIIVDIGGWWWKRRKSGDRKKMAVSGEVRHFIENTLCMVHSWEWGYFYVALSSPVMPRYPFPRKWPKSWGTWVGRGVLTLPRSIFVHFVKIPSCWHTRSYNHISLKSVVHPVLENTHFWSMNN